MSEQGDFNELPLDDSNRRAILDFMPVLKAIGHFLETGYLSNDPGCETYAWRQVRAACNNISSALAWLQEAVLTAEQPNISANRPGG